MDYLILIVVSYLIGSIPFGIVIGWMTKKQDIREYGTKNAGASNTFLVVGPMAAAATALLDVAKGFFAAALGWIFFQSEPVVAFCGLAVITGHIWPIFFRFRGGKGVATAAGVFLFISGITFFWAMLLWAMLVLLWRYVALSNVLAYVLMPLIALWMDLPNAYILFAIMNALFMVISHRSNIERFFTGHEPTLVQWLNKQAQG